MRKLGRWRSSKPLRSRTAKKNESREALNLLSGKIVRVTTPMADAKTSERQAPSLQMIRYEGGDDRLTVGELVLVALQ